MLTILPILQLAFGLIDGILANKSIISQNTGDLITKLSGLGSSLLAAIIGAKGTTTAGLDITMAGLGTLAGIITVLKSNTNISPDFLAYLNQAETSVQASLAAYVIAGKGFSIEAYAPVPEV